MANDWKRSPRAARMSREESRSVLLKKYVRKSQSVLLEKTEEEARSVLLEKYVRKRLRERESHPSSMA